MVGIIHTARLLAHGGGVNVIKACREREQLRTGVPCQYNLNQQHRWSGQYPSGAFYFFGRSV